MPKFNVSITFSLTTEVEPEVSRHTWDTDAEGVSDFNDESYFQRQDAESDGGDLKFVVEAEDEDAAREIAESVIADGNEVEDDTGLTWQVDSVEIEVEEIEPEMDLDSAKRIVNEWLNAALLPEELKLALRFILDATTATPFNS